MYCVKRTFEEYNGTNHVNQKSKKIKHNHNDMITNKKNADSDVEEEEESPLPFIFGSKGNDMIYRSKNHIYFRSDVTMETISKLCKLINEINEEFEMIESYSKIFTPKAKPIYLHITSDGGVVFAGLMGMDAIENSRIPIYTIVEGNVMSSGTLLSLAGTRRFMTQNSYMMIHQLSAGATGNFEQLADSQNNNKTLMKRICNIYETKTNGNLKGRKLANILKHDIYLDFNRCKNYGLIDELYVNDQIVLDC